MLAVYNQIARAADSVVPVLIVGESGTGKELVARALHRNSQRAARPFVAINCGALTETLLESELFGHTRGAFTGAVADTKGIFEQAQGGTVFLDEIGETSPALQVKLLRVLEEGEVRPVGGSRAIKVDNRVIAATNRDLERAAAEQQFRADLYYRLSVIVIRVPALRERRDDIPLLITAFLKAASKRAGRQVELSSGALDVLLAYDWPGNVRQLENTIERIVLFSRGSVIEPDDLPTCCRAAAAIHLPDSLKTSRHSRIWSDATSNTCFERSAAIGRERPTYSASTDARSIEWPNDMESRWATTPTGEVRDAAKCPRCGVHARARCSAGGEDERNARNGAGYL